MKKGDFILARVINDNFKRQGFLIDIKLYMPNFKFRELKDKEALGYNFNRAFLVNIHELKQILDIVPIAKITLKRNKGRNIEKTMKKYIELEKQFENELKKLGYVRKWCVNGYQKFINGERIS